MTVPLASIKICDWALNFFLDHFRLHQERNVKVIMKPKVPQKACFQVYIIQCHGPMGFAMREAYKVLLLQKSWDHGKEMFCFFYFFSFCVPNIVVVSMKEGEKIKHENPQNCPFSSIY